MWFASLVDKISLYNVMSISGPCNSFDCLGHYKHVYDDDNEDDDDDDDDVLSVMCQQIWDDDYLIWNPDDYDGIRLLILPSWQIWHLDLGIDNR